MTNYIFIENGKINGCGQARQLGDNIQNIEVEECLYNDFCENPNKYIWDDNNIVLNVNYEAEKALDYKKELINDIYEIKANKAYCGVIINDMLVFETNQTSITNTVASLALMSDTATANWKFYTVGGEPYVQQVSKLQLAGIAQFGQNMINECFAVEGQANENLQNATIEQLNDEVWRNDFINGVQAEMDKVNNKLTVSFE